MTFDADARQLVFSVEDGRAIFQSTRRPSIRRDLRRVAPWEHFSRESRLFSRQTVNSQAYTSASEIRQQLCILDIAECKLDRAVGTGTSTFHGPIANRYPA